MTGWFSQIGSLQRTESYQYDQTLPYYTDLSSVERFFKIDFETDGPTGASASVTFGIHDGIWNCNSIVTGNLDSNGKLACLWVIET